MTSSSDELRTARIDLYKAEARHATLEGDYAALKIAEETRKQRVDANSAPEDNILTFAGDVTDKSVYTAIQTLGIFSRREPGCDITILLTTPGGSVLAGFALYDYIRQLREKGHKVTIQVIGYAMSMGVTLLQAADERLISPNSFLLIHETSGGGENMTFSQAKDNLKHAQMMQDKMFETLAERGNLTSRQLKAKAARTDWLIDSKEALKHGLVDSIA